MVGPRVRATHSPSPFYRGLGPDLLLTYRDQAILEINMTLRPSPAFMLVSIVSRPSKTGIASLSQFTQCLGLNLLDLLFGHG